VIRDLSADHHARGDGCDEGTDVGPKGVLAEQAHMAEFYFPQRGIFAIGRAPGPGSRL